MPTSNADKAGGFPRLDANALVPAADLPATVDAVARSAASSAQNTAASAQTLAAAAVPSSLANKVNGWLQLDIAGLVPSAMLETSGVAAGACSKPTVTARGIVTGCTALTGNDILTDQTTIGVDSGGHLTVIGGSSSGTDSVARASASAAQTTANAAIPASMLGKASGPAALDSAATLNPNTVSAGGASIPLPIQTIMAEDVRGSLYGMKCDGSTDDSNALLAAFAAASAKPFGGMILLPPGRCLLSKQIAVTTKVGISLIGRGVSATTLVWNGTSQGIAVGLSSQASFDASGMTLTKVPGANPTTGTYPRFYGTALKVYGMWIDDGSFAHDQAGQVQISNLLIQGPTGGSQTDGWAAGVDALDLNFPSIWNVTVKMPGGVASTAWSSPDNLAAPVAGAGAGQAGSGIVLEGDVAPGTFKNGRAGTVDYTLDPSIWAIATAGGTAGIDMNSTQGGYFSTSRFLAGDYGIRSEGSTATDENVTVTGSYFQDFVQDVYTKNLDGITFTGNTLWEYGPSAAGQTPFAGVFIRGGNDEEITGNTLQLAGGNTYGVAGYGIWIGSDSSNTFPKTITGNTVLAATTAAIGNDANVQGITASGNNMSGSDPQIMDRTVTASLPAGSNDYIGNASPYPDIHSDTKGDVAVRRSLSCGGPNDTCIFRVLWNGATFLSTDQYANLAVAGAVSTPGNVNLTGCGYLGADSAGKNGSVAFGCNAGDGIDIVEPQNVAFRVYQYGQSNPALSVGSNGTVFGGPVQLPGYTVATLPTGCTAGQTAYATDGRKAGEAAGAGSGVAVICTSATKGSATSWMAETLTALAN